MHNGSVIYWNFFITLQTVVPYSKLLQSSSFSSKVHFLTELFYLKIYILATFDLVLTFFCWKLIVEKETHDRKFIFFYVGAVVNSIKLVQLSAQSDVYFSDFAMRKVLNRCQWRNTPIYSQPQHPGQLTCFSLSSVEPYQGGVENLKRKCQAVVYLLTWSYFERLVQKIVYKVYVLEL